MISKLVARSPEQDKNANKVFLILTFFPCFSRQDGVGTVTQQEKESFAHVKERLRILLERHLTNFRFVFPFGRPEGALKSTISLLERVSSIHFMGWVGFNQEEDSFALVKERFRKFWSTIKPIFVLSFFLVVQKELLNLPYPY